MRAITIILIISGLFCVSGAVAEDLEKEREEVKAELLLPECSWSKMKKEEYQACQKKRDTLKVMTPKERARYLEHTEPSGVVVTDPGGLVRNKIISGGGAGGGGRPR